MKAISLLAIVFCFVLGGNSSAQSKDQSIQAEKLNPNSYLILDSGETYVIQNKLVYKQSQNKKDFVKINEQELAQIRLDLIMAYKRKVHAYAGASGIINSENPDHTKDGARSTLVKPVLIDIYRNAPPSLQLEDPDILVGNLVMSESARKDNLYRDRPQIELKPSRPSAGGSQ